MPSGTERAATASAAATAKEDVLLLSLQLSLQLKRNKMANLPKYRCHKVVEAEKISAIEIREDGSAAIAPTNESIGTIYTKPGYKERFKGSESDLGYYVRYEDGYESWSPTKAFEDGYTRVRETSPFGVGEDEDLDDEPMPPADVADLARICVRQVESLSKSNQKSVALLDEIVATFSIEKNRESLSETEIGKEMLEVADRWIKRHRGR